MTSSVIFSLIILLLVVISVRERVRQRTFRGKDLGAIGEVKSSQVSQALANLVGVAGGIYLSLVVIATFMELQVPERVWIGSLTMEPLAALSIITALAQPYLQNAIDSWRRV